MSLTASRILDSAAVVLGAAGALPGPFGLAARLLAAGAEIGATLAREAPQHVGHVRTARQLVQVAVAHRDTKTSDDDFYEGL